MTILLMSSHQPTVTKQRRKLKLPRMHVVIFAESVVNYALARAFVVLHVLDVVGEHFLTNHFQMTVH